MGYNRDTVISKCEEQMKKPDLFYTYGLVANSTGKTTDTNEWYTEIIAQYVLDKRLL